LYHRSGGESSDATLRQGSSSAHRVSEESLAHWLGNEGIGRVLAKGMKGARRASQRVLGEVASWAKIASNRSLRKKAFGAISRVVIRLYRME
jgi:hypothetical protein